MFHRGRKDEGGLKVRNTTDALPEMLLLNSPLYKQWQINITQASLEVIVLILVIRNLVSAL